MKINLFVTVMSFLLTFVVMISLHQRYGWKPKEILNGTAIIQLGFDHENIKLRKSETNEKSKSLFKDRPLDKYKCLSQLNVNIKAKMMYFPFRRCVSYPLKDDKTGKRRATLDFCSPFHTKFLIAASAIKCEQNGYWVYDQNGCMRQFTSMKNEKELKAFMKRPGIGFSKSTPLDKYDHRLVFFSDTCEIDEQNQRLNCGLFRKGQNFAYRLTPNLIPYGPYDFDFASIACRTY